MKLRLLAVATVAALLSLSATVHAQDLTSESGKASYALGYRVGNDLRVYTQAGEKIDTNSLMKGLQDALAGRDVAVPGEQLGAALNALDTRVQAKLRADAEKVLAENKAKGDAFLAQNRGKAGVKVLPSGVQYRVIEPGTGAKPTQNNQITVEFRLTTADGREIDDTNKVVNGQAAGPVTARLSDIPYQGLKEALQMMPAGARWEVVLPPSQGVGSSLQQAGPLANSTVVFNIKLLSVGPVLPPPPPRPAAPAQGQQPPAPPRGN